MAYPLCWKASLVLSFRDLAEFAVRIEMPARIGGSKAAFGLHAVAVRRAQLDPNQ
jgi:hypothetical protein